MKHFTRYKIANNAIILICIFLLLSVKLGAQGVSVKPKLSCYVQTNWETDWGHHSLVIPKDYWENKAGQVISQVGTEEFEKIKQFSNRNNIPCEMLLFCEDRNGSPKKNSDSLNKKLSRLKVCRIAMFTYTNLRGKTIGPIAIVKARYKENIDWNKNAKWDSVYFILENEYLNDSPEMREPKAFDNDGKALKSVNIADWRKLINDIDNNYWFENKLDDDIVRKIGWTEYTNLKVSYRRGLPSKIDFSNAAISKLFKHKLLLGTFTAKSKTFAIIKLIYFEPSDDKTVGNSKSVFVITELENIASAEY